MTGIAINGYVKAINSRHPSFHLEISKDTETKDPNKYNIKNGTNIPIK